MDRASYPGRGEHSRSISPEQYTGLRFSLAYEPIGSIDYLVNHPSGKQRIVEYPSTSKRLRRLKNKLVEQRLILGSEMPTNSAESRAFIVPSSARPLAYDSGSRVEGSYSYNDNKLFSDLGGLLAKLLVIDNKNGYVVKGDIGHTVAITEFAFPGQRQLFFVPGVEHVIQQTNPDFPSLVEYESRLESEFGNRFYLSIEQFRAGFMIDSRDTN